MDPKELLVIAATVALAGCSGGSYGPSGPAPPADLTGTYAAAHTFILVGVGPINDQPCPGTLEIQSQSGYGFTGVISLDAAGDCEGIGGVTGAVSGTTSGNQVTLSITGIEDPLAALGCQITGGEPSFTGTATTTEIDVSRRIEGMCTVGSQTLEADVDWRIVATKT